MVILSFLLQLFGATFLLLIAVRMVRSGIERAFGAGFGGLCDCAGGCRRQSAGFAGSGTIAFLPAVAIVLGGDLGSALLVPVFLTVGGVLFLKTERRNFGHEAYTQC